MSVKKCMDNIACTLDCVKNKTLGTYRFLKSLSLKNKASLELQLKSDKTPFPLCKCGFAYNKTWRIMPVIYVMIGVVMICGVMKSAFSKDK